MVPDSKTATAEEKAHSADLTEKLKNEDIHGVKYLDAKSRRAGEGSRNYVIYNDKHILITHRNDEPILNVALREVGIDPATVSGDVRDKTLDIMVRDHITHPLDAYQQAVKELSDEAEARAKQSGETRSNDGGTASGEGDRVGEVVPAGFEESGDASPPVGENNRGQIADRIFTGDTDRSLKTIFSSEHYDGSHVDLHAAGLNEEEIKALHDAGFATHDGKMAAGQFVAYDKERAARGFPERDLSREVVDLPAFRKWFGDSKVVDAEGKPIVVYHGTDAEAFDEFHPGSWFTAQADEANAYSFHSDLRRREKATGKYSIANGADEFAGKRLPYFGTISDIEEKKVGKVYATDQGVMRYKGKGEWEILQDLKPNDDTYDPVADDIQVIAGDDSAKANETVKEYEDWVRDTYPRGDGGRVYPAYLSIKNPKELDALEANRLGLRLGATRESIQKAVDKYKAEGYDGIVSESDEARMYGAQHPEMLGPDGKPPKQYVIFDKDQVKSAIGMKDAVDRAHETSKGAPPYEPPKTAPVTVEPSPGATIPEPKATTPLMAPTFDHLVDHVLEDPYVAAAIHDPKINRKNDVPYGAGPNNANDGVVNVDRHVPKTDRIQGVKYEPARAVAVHEFVEKHVMEILSKAGIPDNIAYEVAHFVFAEPAERAWVQEHIGFKAWDIYQKHWDKWLANIDHENPKNPPADLYQKPYPHDDDHLAPEDRSSDKKFEETGHHNIKELRAIAERVFGERKLQGAMAAGQMGDVEATVRSIAHEASVAAAASSDPLDRQIGQILDREVSPLIDAAFKPAVDEKPLDEKVHAETLLAFLKRLGGVKDSGGDLSGRSLHRAYPGLVNNKRGMELDDARAAAAEQGYLGGDVDHAMATTTVSDLLDALTEHPHYSVFDGKEVDRARDAASYNLSMRRLADARDEINKHLKAVDEKYDAETVAKAAEIYTIAGSDIPIDNALEDALMFLSRQESENALLHRERSEIPEVNHEAASIDSPLRRQGDEGPYFGDRSGTEGHFGTDGGEVQHAGENRPENDAENARPHAALEAARDEAENRMSRAAHEVHEAMAKHEQGLISDHDLSVAEDAYDNAVAAYESARRDLLTTRNEERRALAAEAGPEGMQQTLMDGVAPVTDADRIKVESERKLHGGNATPPEGGLFDMDARAQRDMFDSKMSEPEQVRTLMERDAGRPGGTGLPTSGGAAAADTRELKLKNYGVPDWLKGVPFAGPGAEAVGTVLNQFSPMLRNFTSRSVFLRRATADLAETALWFWDNLKGITTSYGGPPLDRLIKTQQRKYQITTDLHLTSAFIEYRYGTNPPAHAFTKSGFEDIIGRSGDKMSFSQFKAEVSRALYSGDKHEIPQVARAAKGIRKEVLDPVAQMAQETKGPDGLPMLAQELSAPLGDESYGPRVYNKEALAANRNDAKRKFADYLQEDQTGKAAASDRLKDLQTQHDTIVAAQKKMDGRIATLDRRLAELEPALKERGMETNRATDRVETLQERNDKIDADSEELRQVLAETKSAITAPDADPWDMEAYDNLKRQYASLQRARWRNDIRVNEAGVPVNASQTRFMDLADRQARYQTMKDLMVRARENAENERLGTRAKMEDEIRNWKGNSAREAEGALKARDEAERLRDLKKDAGVSEGKGNRLTSADDAVDSAVKRIIEKRRDLDRGELEDKADEIIDRILGSPDGRLAYDEHPTLGPPEFSGGQEVRGALRNRTFPIPSAAIHDFLEHDTQHLVTCYLRSILPDVHLTRRFGDIEMSEQFRKINEEYSRMAAGMTSEKELVALEKERQGGIRDLAAIRDRLRGVYGWSPDPRSRNAARISGIARNWNMLADLGTSVANRLGDAGANGVFRHGFMNVMHDSWRPMFQAMTGNPTLAKAYREQAMAMAVGTDGMLGHMAHDFGDAMENYRPGSKFERGLSWAADKSMLINMHGPWTDWTKTMISGVASAEIIRASERIVNGVETAKDIERLAANNIDRNMAVKIWKNYSDGGGQIIEGTHVPNTRDWKDLDARTAFEAAVGREADIAVITPGMEKPLWMSGPVAGLIGQFKSFVAGSYERLLISNLQQRDARTIQGLLTAVATGMVSYRLYTWLSGKPASDNPADWIKEGIHRSAILSWFSEINEMQAKFTGGATDMYRLTGATSPLTRRDQSPAGALLGPTYSRIEGLLGATGDALRAMLAHTVGGDPQKVIWTAQDTHKLRELMFLQNLAGFRILLDKAEDGINSALGVPHRDKSNKIWNPRSSANAIQESTPPPQ